MPSNTFADLERRARKNPNVDYVLTAFKAGQFHSLEHALLTLCCHLVDVNSHLLDPLTAIAAARMRPVLFIKQCPACGAKFPIPDLTTDCEAPDAEKTP